MKQIILVLPTLLLFIGIITLPNQSFAWSNCGTPQAESDCPKSTRSPHVTQTATAYPTHYRSNSPTPTPTPTPTPRGTEEATPSPSATPTVEPNQTPSPASQNTGSGTSEYIPPKHIKDCRVEDCNTHIGQALPQTGSNNLNYIFGVGGLLFGMGIIIKSIKV